MENIKEQFVRLYMELDLTDDQAAMINKLQRDVEAALRQPLVSGQSEQLVCEHPDEAIIRDKPTDYCLVCNRNI